MDSIFLILGHIVIDGHVSTKTFTFGPYISKKEAEQVLGFLYVYLSIHNYEAEGKRYNAHLNEFVSDGEQLHLLQEVGSITGTIGVM